MPQRATLTAHERGGDGPSTMVTRIWSLMLLFGFVAALFALTTLLHPAWAQTTAGSTPDAQRQRELVRFVRQECGFCHGLRLTGGLGTPLTAEALADQPAEALQSTILYGRAGTAMPGWSPFLSEADTHWIVHKLLQGFPDETAR